MDETARTRPPAQRFLYVSLPVEPQAAAQARHRVREAIAAWGLPADPDTAALLTSELVTNAIRYSDTTVRLLVTGSCSDLRVFVYDGSCDRPAPLDTTPDAEEGRGLMLVASLATDWGCCRAAAGKAVYFTLASESAYQPAGVLTGHDGVTLRPEPQPGPHVCPLHTGILSTTRGHRARRLLEPSQEPHGPGMRAT